MANLSIVTPIRDAGGRVKAYRERVESLEWDGEVEVVLVEGDSEDGTREYLQGWAEEDEYHGRVRATLIRHDVGVPKFGSVVDAERFRILSGVINKGLDMSAPLWADWVLVLPDDISFEPDLAMRLKGWGKPAISPFVWQGKVFYDVWAFHFKEEGIAWPTRSGLEGRGWYEPIEMESVGGVCLIEAGYVWRGLRYPAEDLDIGMSRLMREMGGSVWADPTTHVEHVPHGGSG